MAADQWRLKAALYISGNEPHSQPDEKPLPLHHRNGHLSDVRHTGGGGKKEVGGGVQRWRMESNRASSLRERHSRQQFIRISWAPFGTGAGCGVGGRRRVGLHGGVVLSFPAVTARAADTLLAADPSRFTAGQQTLHSIIARTLFQMRHTHPRTSLLSSPAAPHHHHTPPSPDPI